MDIAGPGWNGLNELRGGRRRNGHPAMRAVNVAGAGDKLRTVDLINPEGLETNAGTDDIDDCIHRANLVKVDLING